MSVVLVWTCWLSNSVSLRHGYATVLGSSTTETKRRAALAVTLIPAKPSHPIEVAGLSPTCISTTQIVFHACALPFYAVLSATTRHSCCYCCVSGLMNIFGFFVCGDAMSPAFRFSGCSYNHCSHTPATETVSLTKIGNTSP